MADTLVTDDGLVHLRKFKHLETLSLLGTAVSKRGEFQLRQWFPNAQVFAGQIKF